MDKKNIEVSPTINQKEAAKSFLLERNIVLSDVVKDLQRMQVQLCGAEHEMMLRDTPEVSACSRRQTNLACGHPNDDNYSAAYRLTEYLQLAKDIERSTGMVFEAPIVPFYNADDPYGFDDPPKERTAEEKLKSGKVALSRMDRKAGPLYVSARSPDVTSRTSLPMVNVKKAVVVDQHAAVQPVIEVHGKVLSFFRSLQEAPLPQSAVQA